MEKENKDINSIFIEIRKNIDGEFLYSEKWTTDDFDFEYNSLESNDPKDFVKLHDLLIGLSPSLSFSDYLQINEMIKLEKKRVGNDNYLDFPELIESTDYSVYNELFRHGRIKDLNEMKKHMEVSYLFDFDSVPFPW